MDPESSLPYSQELATVPYTEPDVSNHHTLFKIHFNIVLPVRLPSDILEISGNWKRRFFGFTQGCKRH